MDILRQNNKTNLHKALEISILLQLVLHALLRNWEMPDVGRICQPEFCGCFEEYIANTVNNRRLLPLPYEDDLEQVAVTFAKVEHIAKDFVHEFVNFTRSDDRRVSVAQRANEELCARLSIVRGKRNGESTYGFDGVQIAQVLLLLMNKFVDDAEDGRQN